MSLRTLLALSLLSVAALVGMAVRMSVPAGSANGSSEAFVVYCAAGIQGPIAEAAVAYENEPFGSPIQLQYGGSGTLLANLQIAGKGALFVAADESYTDLARAKGLVRETLPIARIRPVIVVAPGNPLRISHLSDLLRDDVRVSLANPDAASIGRVCQRVLEQAGLWKQLQQSVTVFKPTVNDLLTDVVLGAVDASIVWDANASQSADEMDIVRTAELDAASQTVTVGILASCRQPAAALRFARYLQAPQKGQQSFSRFRYQTIEGDAWEEVPEITLYSGGVNRIAIQKTIDEFQFREGVALNVVYNGCGILVSQILSGAQPDAYFACDVSFLDRVTDRFPHPETLSQTQIIVAARKGLEPPLANANDLARSDLKLGMANPDQSALGRLTTNLLEAIPYESTTLLSATKPNVVVQTPTADLLVNQLRAGGLDAVIVYRANVANVVSEIELLTFPTNDVEGQADIACQPFAIHQQTRYPYLLQRLADVLKSEVSQKRFEKAGFGWLLPQTTLDL